MRITLQYFDGCPNWQETRRHLDALRAESVEFDLDIQLVDSPEVADALAFRGSPTILIDGTDPFADEDAPVGLACRLYETGSGHAGSPTLDQLRSAISTAAGA